MCVIYRGPPTLSEEGPPNSLVGTQKVFVFRHDTEYLKPLGSNTKRDLKNDG